MGTTTLIVSGMTCDGCSSRLTENFLKDKDIINANISHESGIAKIEHSEGITYSKLEEVVITSGFSIGKGFDWRDISIWKQSAHNTKWCLIGCSIGDFGTIAAFQFIFTDSGWSTMSIMVLAIINGLLTSIALETAILSKQMELIEGFKVAIGMSFISMIAMETSMNITDYLMTGGAMLTWWAIPIMLIVGFITPWPYNYWRLKKFGKACH